MWHSYVTPYALTTLILNQWDICYSNFTDEKTETWGITYHDQDSYHLYVTDGKKTQGYWVPKTTLKWLVSRAV